MKNDFKSNHRRMRSKIEIGEYLRNLREGKGLTKHELSEELRTILFETNKRSFPALESYEYKEILRLEKERPDDYKELISKLNAEEKEAFEKIHNDFGYKEGQKMSKQERGVTNISLSDLDVFSQFYGISGECIMYDLSDYETALANGTGFSTKATKILSEMPFERKELLNTLIETKFINKYIEGIQKAYLSDEAKETLAYDIAMLKYGKTHLNKIIFEDSNGNRRRETFNVGYTDKAGMDFIKHAHSEKGKNLEETQNEIIAEIDEKYGKLANEVDLEDSLGDFATVELQRREAEMQTKYNKALINVYKAFRDFANYDNECHSLTTNLIKERISYDILEEVVRSMTEEEKNFAELSYNYWNGMK